MNVAVLLVRAGVGALLIVAGALKVGHPSSLAASIAAFRLLPAAVVGPLALALPYLELLLGAYLVLGLFTRVAAALAAGQFLIYAAAIASAILRHIPANCGCFGPRDVAVADWRHVAVDCALAILAAFVSAAAPGALALDRKLHSA